MEETAAALVGFYPAFSPLFPPTPFSLFLSLFSLPLFFISNNFIFYLSIPLCVPSMPVFKVHLLPLPPLTPVSADSRAVYSSATHTRTCLHKGRKKKKTSVLPTTPLNAFYFNIGRNPILIWRFFVFVFFSLRSGLNVARNTNSCLCVRTCIQNGIITTVLDVFLYNNLSFLNFFFFLIDH